MIEGKDIARTGIGMHTTPKDTRRARCVVALIVRIKAAAEGPLNGILGYNDGPLVSIDFNHDAHSSVFDSTLTKVIEGNLVKVCSWYDNEWGFSNRMLDTTLALVNAT